jgi:hypothetical protein
MLFRPGSNHLPLFIDHQRPRAAGPYINAEKPDVSLLVALSQWPARLGSGMANRGDSKR